MGYNHQSEWKKFRKEMNARLCEYVEAGIPYKKFRKIYRFEWRWFCSNRNYYESTQPIHESWIEGGEINEGRPSLLHKFPRSFSVDARITDPDRRHGWVDEIDDEDLVKVLKKMTESDLELIHLLAFEGYKQSEVARMKGTTKQAVNNKKMRLRKVLEKVAKTS